MIVRAIFPGVPAGRQQRRRGNLPSLVRPYSGRDSGARTCTFASYEQCMMAVGPGTGGSCIQNPWFLWNGSNDPAIPVRKKGEGSPSRSHR